LMAFYESIAFHYRFVSPVARVVHVIQEYGMSDECAMIFLPADESFEDTFAECCFETRRICASLSERNGMAYKDDWVPTMQCWGFQAEFTEQ